jgi:hypothetical protein
MAENRHRGGKILWLPPVKWKYNSFTGLRRDSGKFESEIIARGPRNKSKIKTVKKIDYLNSPTKNIPAFTFIFNFKFGSLLDVT